MLAVSLGEKRTVKPPDLTRCSSHIDVLNLYGIDHN